MLTKMITVALVGNPNTGKTTLFNALSGLRQRVGNYPGVTVEMKKGQTRLGSITIDLIDLPGTYSLAPRSIDEMVAVDLLLGHQPNEPRPDAIISIVDASNLERHLYLTTQLLDLDLPVVLAVNMLDVAKSQGIQLDLERLSKELGLPVVPIQANKSIGLDQLKEVVLRTIETQAKPTSKPAFPKELEDEVQKIETEFPTMPDFLAHRGLLDVGGYTEKRLAETLGPVIGERIRSARERLATAGIPIPAIEARTRYGWIRAKVAACITYPAQRPVTWTDRLDRILTHKIAGTLIFLALMFCMFMAVFEWATPLMTWIDEGKEWLVDLVKKNMDAGPLRSLITDGVIKGVGSVLIFLPQILILFAFIAILEDCGYMARAAFLMDRIMSRCGLNGKSFIPLLSSMACAVPGILATRVIENRRDRLATILVAPLMSCSARLPLYMIMAYTFLREPSWLPAVALFAIYLLGLIVAPLVALCLKRTLLKGATPIFVLEMPAYKWPTFRTVLRRMYDAGLAFVQRAGTLILATMIIIWALLYFPNHRPDGTRYDVDFNAATEWVEQYEEDVELPEAWSSLQTEPSEEMEAYLKAAYVGSSLCSATVPLSVLHAEWKSNSYLGQLGKAMTPIFSPLGWDWRIGMAALASFPAREVVVGVLGIIYNQGDIDPKSVREADDPSETPLASAIQSEWANDPIRGPYRIPVALGLMVFFALCCQCASTLAVIRRETNSWTWPLFTFTYMTILAYLGALCTYQVGRMLVDLIG